MTEEEYAAFVERLSAYNMSQTEFIRQAITGAAIRPVITVSSVNDELLAGEVRAADTDRGLPHFFPQLRGEDFAVACMRANLRHEKNQKWEDVKSHHDIISFDPRDGTDNGLIVDRAQELGEQFCKEHFPGRQVLICKNSNRESSFRSILIFFSIFQ